MQYNIVEASLRPIYTARNPRGLHVVLVLYPVFNKDMP